MANVKAEVLSKVEEIGGWATVTNYGAFRSAVEKYFNRVGTEFSRAYYRLLRYSFAEAILEHLEAERPTELPAMPTRRPRGYYDIREVLSEDVGTAICDEILLITREQYGLGLETDGGMPPTYKSRELERWTTGLTQALSTAASELTLLGNELEARYNEYYEAIVSGRCGRTRLKDGVWIEDLTMALYEARHHAGFVEEYGLIDDEPVEIREMMTNDVD